MIQSLQLLNESIPQSFSCLIPAEQLQQIYVAGFELKVFDRFPKCVGVVRENCVAC